MDHDATDELLPPLGGSADAGEETQPIAAEAPHAEAAEVTQPAEPDDRDDQPAIAAPSAIEQARAELAEAEAQLAEIGDREADLKAVARDREAHLTEKQRVLDSWELIEGDLDTRNNQARQKAQDLYPVQRAATARAERARKRVAAMEAGAAEEVAE